MIPRGHFCIMTFIFVHFVASTSVLKKEIQDVRSNVFSFFYRVVSPL